MAIFFNRGQMTNALKKYIAGRTYKERSQPAARQKLGILEKHKDYSERAKNFNLKKKRLRALKEKALNKNPDEFYFGMIKAKTKNGVHVKTQEDEKLEPEVIKLMKTQDLNYISLQKRKEEKKIEKLKEQTNAEAKKELNTRIQRKNNLAIVEAKLALKKDLAGKGTKYKVGVQENGVLVYKWKNERKK